MSTQVAEAFDAIVIGSGQGGNPLAGALVAAGKKTALIERQDVGGTCINRGCTPTKTMVASARAAYLARRGADYGVHVGPVTVDMGRVRERKRAIVQQLARGRREASGEGACRADTRRSFLHRSQANSRCASRRRGAAAERGAILYQYRHSQRCAGD